MSREIYDAIPALNFSKAKYLLDSPAHFKAAEQRKPEPEDETRFAVGTLVHAMVLEGKTLLDLYAIKPEGMKFNTREGKEWRDAQTLPILTSEESASIPAMAEAIAADKEAAKLLHACQFREQIMQATVAGVNCKALLDCSGKDSTGWRGFVDLKTTATGSDEREFSKKVETLHYDMQMAWYGALLSMHYADSDLRPWSAWIVVETKPPYIVRTYWPSDDFLRSGIDKMSRALAIYDECQKSGYWPKPAYATTELNRPAWAKPIND